MSKLSKIFDSIAATSGKLAKLDILLKNVDNDTLRMSFALAYNPQTNFYITVDKAECGKSGKIELDVKILKDVYDHLHGRLVTGNAAREYLDRVLADLVPEDQVILKRIINRDLEIGASIGSAEKVWSGLIPSFPVMLADKFNAKTAELFTKPNQDLMVQLKCDGGRAAAVCENNKVTMFSRNGNELEVWDHFSFLSVFDGYVVDGELLSLTSDGKIADRKTSNGIFNKAVRGTISQEEASKLTYVVWDMIPLDEFRAGKGKTPYRARFTELQKKLKGINNDFISLVPSKDISDIGEAEKFFEEQLAAGEEGAMLKLASGVWEDKRVKTVLKLKDVKDATLRCIGVKPHSKHPELIGSLECATSCGKLEVSIGTGLSADDRKRPASYFLNNLIDMKYNQLILGKDATTYSMFLPVYRGLREDVNEADSLAKLM